MPRKIKVISLNNIEIWDGGGHELIGQGFKRARDYLIMMSQAAQYGPGDVIYVVLERLGGSVDGLKKLMKLLFLVQYDIRRGLLGKRAVKYLYNGMPITGVEYFLWSFGPMSNEVYTALDELEDNNVISTEALDNLYTTVRISIASKRQVDLPGPVLSRIDKVIRKYGGYRGWELERLVKRLLGLEVEEKRNEYLGYYVDDYLRREGFNLTVRDLAYGQVEE